MNYYLRSLYGLLTALLLLSLSFTVNAQNPMVGIYTVDPSLPTDVTSGGTNFNDLPEAADTLANWGISGDVVVMVSPHPNGYYHKQVIFKNVPGASFSSTITVKGSTGNPSDVIVGNTQSSILSNSLTTFTFEEASHYIIEDMHLRFDSLSGQQRGVVWLRDDANFTDCSNITFRNLEFTSWTYNWSIQGDGHGIVIEDCHFIDNYYSARIRGNGTRFRNNDLDGPVDLGQVTGVFFTGENIHVTDNDVFGVGVGLGLNGGSNHVGGNKIDKGGLSITYDFVTNSDLVDVSNNFVYARPEKGPPPFGGSSYCNTALTLSPSFGSLRGGQVYVRNNTLVADHYGYPTVRFNYDTIGFVAIESNIIASFGTRLYQFADSIDYPFGLESDNNAFFATYNIPFGDLNSVVNYNTLADWQAGTNQDQNSLWYLPDFADTSMGDLHLTGPSTPIAGKSPTYYQEDIDGELRRVTSYLGADEYYAPVVPVIDSVWPGDANYDGVANNLDLLPIGLQYNTTGPARANASIVWQPEFATDWTTSLTFGVNTKHADCNGDGTVNGADTLAILQNYGLTHMKQSGRDSSDVYMYLSLDTTTITEGDTVIGQVLLGRVSSPANNVYGVAYTLNYDPAIVDAMNVNYSRTNSWFTPAANGLSINKNFPTQGRMDVAQTRTDLMNVSGAGVIAEVSFVIQDDLHAKKAALTGFFSISDVTVIDTSGAERGGSTGADSLNVLAEVIQDTTVVDTTSTGIEDASALNDFVQLSPNPFNDQLTLNISYELKGALEVQLVDMMGSVLKEYELEAGNHTLAVSQVPVGVYLVNMKDSAGAWRIVRVVKY